MKLVMQRLGAKPGSLLSASALLFISTTVVNAGNYLSNLVLGRWLGPAAFAEVNLIVTLMLVFALVTTTLQTVAARFAAGYSATNDVARLLLLRNWAGRWAWRLGAGLGLVLGCAAPLLASFFHLRSPWVFVLLALALPAYFALGIERGVLQGQTRFGWLALNYQVEMMVRLAGIAALVSLGWAVNGAVLALTLSVVAAWAVAKDWRLARRTCRSFRLDFQAFAFQITPEQRAILTYAGPVAAALLGQILITNSDVLLVKRFFSASEAGLYAAVALVGRIVFFATWSVVTTIFPLVAQRHQRGEPHRHLLLVGLGLVAAASLPMIGLALVAPDWVVQLLFGGEYLSIAPLLWLYALATALYALANVIISYRLAFGSRGGATLALLAGVAQVAGITLWHADLRQVVLVQVGLMAALFGLLLLWELRTWILQTLEHNNVHLARKARPAISGPGAASVPDRSQ